MTLPTSGPMSASMINVELKRAANAVFSLNGAEERKLAGILSGPISFSDFYGKSNEEIVILTSDSTKDRMDLYFTPEIWQSDITKRIILPAGIEYGSSLRYHAIATASTTAGQAGSFGGELIFEVNGILSGRGGDANGGVGGTALFANLPGRDGQKLKIINNGVIRAGGGGGGRGGVGGGGRYDTETNRDPVSGEHYSPLGAPRFAWQILTSGGTARILWNEVEISRSIPLDDIHFIHGGFKYYRGTNRSSNLFQVYRTQLTTTDTNGGAGGNGGVGQGYNQAASNGLIGSAGGQNAGGGSYGGAGGAFGASGYNGSKGKDGNRTNGVAGQAGGLAGFAISDMNNVELSGSIQLLGR